MNYLRRHKKAFAETFDFEDSFIVVETKAR